MGSSMSHQFDSEANFSGSYSDITASGGAQYSFERVFKSTTAYAVSGVAQDAYNLSVNNDWHKSVNSNFIQEAKELPMWKLNDTVYETYNAFFNRWGTHVMTQCFAGVRSQLKVEQEAQSEDRKEKFATNVKEEYKGAVGGDAKVEDSKEWSEYKKSRRELTKVLGVP